VEKYCSSYLLENNWSHTRSTSLEITTVIRAYGGAVMISFVKYSFIGGSYCRYMP
jgi:hypothetical protein